MTNFELLQRLQEDLLANGVRELSVLKADFPFVRKDDKEIEPIQTINVSLSKYPGTLPQEIDPVDLQLLKSGKDIKVTFFGNGMALASRHGQQVAELQTPWLEYVCWMLIGQGIDPTRIGHFELPDRTMIQVRMNLDPDNGAARFSFARVGVFDTF